MGFLDANGVSHFWEKIKNKFVEKVDGKGLSTNDYTTEEKTKLKGIAEGANAYTHPAYTAKANGFYKVTVDSTGHISGATGVTKSDITGLGIPAQDTTYSDATTGASGLMSSEDKAKLDGIAKGANAYTHPAYTAKSSGFYKVTVDEKGHVSGTAAVTKDDITGLGIPGQDTKVTVIDGLTSTSTTSALSAKQGKELDERIKELSDSIGEAGYGDMMKSTYDSTGNGVVDNAEKLGGQAPSYYAKAADVPTKVEQLTDADSYAKKTEIPKTVASLSDAGNYALKTDLSTVYKWKGSVATESALPSSGMSVGDVYDIQAESSYGEAGTNVAWTGSAWDSLGTTFKVDTLTNAELDEICV